VRSSTRTFASGGRTASSVLRSPGTVTAMTAL
jgi:hypothetical protein